MATISPQGVVPTDLSEYITLLNGVFIGVFGSDFNTDPDTPQGQIIGLLAFALSQVDNSIVDAVAGVTMSTAKGMQQDNIASNIGIDRKDAVNTEVICQLTGIAGTVIPAGSQAKDIDGRLYLLKEAVTIPAALSVDGVMVLQLSGSQTVAPNTVTQIVTSIAGWETINNSQSGIEGRSVETDAQFYRRYQISVPRNSRTQVSSIRTALLEIEDVDQALVQDNDQPFAQTFKDVVIPAHSVSCYVLGGADQEIFDALGRKKPTGVPYNGNIVGQYDDQSTYTFLEVKFFRALPVDIQIEIDIKITPQFQNDGEQQIKQNIIDYFNGNLPRCGDGGFYPAQQIAQDVIWSRLFTPINRITGHDVESLKIAKLLDPLQASDISIKLNEIGVIDEQNITINVVT